MLFAQLFRCVRKIISVKNPNTVSLNIVILNTVILNIGNTKWVFV